MTQKGALSEHEEEALRESLRRGRTFLKQHLRDDGEGGLLVAFMVGAGWAIGVRGQEELTEEEFKEGLRAAGRCLEEIATRSLEEFQMQTRLIKGAGLNVQQRCAGCSALLQAFARTAEEEWSCESCNLQGATTALLAETSR